MTKKISIFVIMLIAFVALLQGNVFAAKTLPEAVDGVITLTEDVELESNVVIAKGETVVLDLNGHTISQSYEATKAYVMIDNKGTLTIKDSVGNGKISFEDTGLGGEYVSNTISNSGTLIVNGGIIENVSSTTVAKNGYPHAIDTSGKLVVNGGTVSGKNYSAIRVWCTTDDDTSVEINEGATISNAIDMHNVNSNANKGTLTINGGTFKVTNGGTNATTNSVRFLNFGTDYDEIKIRIKDGNFEGGLRLSNYLNEKLTDLATVLKVSGGTFNSVIRGELLEENAEITIKLDKYNDLSLLSRPDSNASDSIVLPKGSKVTLDLNGQTIESTQRAFIVEGAEFTVKGEGKILVTDSADPAIAVKGSNNVNDKDYTKVNIEEDVTLEGLYGLFVAAVDNAYAYGVEVNFNGRTTDGGLYVNGSIQHTENCPVINIGSTANIAEKGIYAAGYAEWNIDGATISGKLHGIGIKSGKFNIKNAKIYGTGEDDRPTEGYNNGMNASGAAIQIESNKGYAGKIDINIENSTIKSENGVSFYEYLATFEDTNLNATETAVNSLKITNCSFASAEGLENFDVSSKFETNIKKFINSGEFSSDVKEFIADGLICAKLNDIYYVVPNTQYSITVKPVEGGKVVVNKVTAQFGEVIEVTVTPDEGYKFVSADILAGEAGDTLTEAGSFVMAFEEDVIITPEFEKLTQVETSKEVADAEKVESIIEETLKEMAKTNPELEELLNNEKITVEVLVSDMKTEEVNATEMKEIEETAQKEVEGIKIVNYLDITVSLKSESANEPLELEKLKEEITFTVPVPEGLPEVAEGYTRVFYIIRNHNGQVDLLDATTSEDEKTISFDSNLFSTYAIAYIDVEKTTGGAEGETSTGSPTTGDNIMVYVVALLVAIVGIYTVARTKKVKTIRKH